MLQVGIWAVIGALILIMIGLAISSRSSKGKMAPNIFIFLGIGTLVAVILLQALLWSEFGALIGSLAEVQLFPPQTNFA
jgi:hypothetical protein